jgi:hypothetical protein
LRYRRRERSDILVTKTPDNVASLHCSFVPVVRALIQEITVISTVDAALSRRSHAPYFTQDSYPGPNWPVYNRSYTREHKKELTDMFQITGSKRIPYARALYLSAIVAVLSACSQTDPVPAEREIATDAVAVSEDVPEVVITASRMEPDFNS